MIRKNITKVFAISIPVVVFNLIGSPFEYLLNHAIVDPTFEFDQFTVIGHVLVSLSISIFSVFTCIKIWNKN